MIFQRWYLRSKHWCIGKYFTNDLNLLLKTKLSSWMSCTQSWIIHLETFARCDGLDWIWTQVECVRHSGTGFGKDEKAKKRWAWERGGLRSTSRSPTNAPYSTNGKHARLDFGIRAPAIDVAHEVCARDCSRVIASCLLEIGRRYRAPTRP